ncbi:glutamyl-tRNA reductase [Cellulomonas hominis]|uniref:glutamyl-tRNA reductase n=1 Tax=Cellulomonas hominis TaxID=156981 RepID=UPI001443FEEE|nr:glutamyl-tRNA reductase [Cellulomonas hominis]NKY09551.1 glutamyl-tRNA reductase [Cellulomonas hominis]
MLSLVASHHDLDLAVLERLSADTHAVGREIVTGCHPVSGAVVLATCNRFELYLDIPDPADAEAARTAVAATVAARSGYTPQHVADALTPATGGAVVEHLFAVASGLESMVVGEREIAGQVRRALTAARRDGTTTSDLEALFQAASRASRAVEGRTGLGAAGRSVVGVALDLVEEGLPDWSDVRCLLIGTGSYAGASLAALKARGCRDVLVYSASGRAGQFAAQRGVSAATSDLAVSLAGVDLVVACSGAAGAVLDVDALIRARSAEASIGARPLAVLDLALQHDVDPAVGELPGVRLVSLTTVAEQAPDGHSATVAEALALVAEQAEAFERTRRTREWNPPVVAERRRVLEELATAADGLPEREARALRRRVRSALHGPTVRARAAAAAGDAAEYAAALAELATVTVPARARDLATPRA